MNWEGCKMNGLNPAGWRKSTRSSGNAACVELATLTDGHRALRDSKLGPASPVLTISAGAFNALLSNIKSGDFV